MAPDTIERAILELNDPSLLRQRCYVDGAWADADDGATMPIVDPATGALVGTAPVFRAAETRRAIDVAERAFPGWRAKTAKERAAILRRWNDLMLANADDLARILTAEQGKPLAETKGEVTIGSAIIQVGSTVERIAIAIARPCTDAGSASASMGRVSANCTPMNTVEASIAQAMKRDEPRRAMMPPAPTR